MPMSNPASTTGRRSTIRHTTTTSRNVATRPAPKT